MFSKLLKEDTIKEAADGDEEEDDRSFLVQARAVTANLTTMRPRL